MADIIQQPIDYEAQEQKLKQQTYIEQEMHREKQEANKLLKREPQTGLWSIITGHDCYDRGMKPITNDQMPWLVTVTAYSIG